ncbi:MAG: phosphoethanolamine transferase [Pontibacterium sp.]
MKPLFRNLNTGFFSPTLSAQQFILLLSVLMMVVYNKALWTLVFNVPAEITITSVFFFASFFVLIVSIFNILLTLVGFKYILKPLAIFIVMSAAFASYFMNSYGIMIDKTMVQNTMETDPGEVMDLLTLQMLADVTLMGILPALMISRTRITYRSIFGELKVRTISIILSVMVVGLVATAFYKEMSSMFRNHREIRHLIVPSNYIYYSLRYLSGAYDKREVTMQAIGTDAKLAKIWENQDKKVVTIVVLGETARAMNFSLNGYERNTNPALSKENVINFPNTQACGTSTAVSVPCMFSNMTRKTYKEETVRSRENVLDVLSHAGLSVMWRDNNSGCKGVCNRIESQRPAVYRADEFCKGEKCHDEVMLNKLDDYLEKAQNNAVIVLHQLGSHGPAYSLRYPPEFKKFTPVCETSNLQSCSQQEIVNAYDNTILYTDYFVSQVINFLKARSDKYTTAMLYMSDHGESLGEGNIYLHGLPYFMAPETQTQVPFITWLSQDYIKNFQVDETCVKEKTSTAVTHDDLFHSLLGLMAVETSVYNADNDLFGTCRR